MGGTRHVDVRRCVATVTATSGRVTSPIELRVGDPSAVAAVAHATGVDLRSGCANLLAGAIEGHAAGDAMRLLIADDGGGDPISFRVGAGGSVMASAAHAMMTRQFCGRNFSSGEWVRTPGCRALRT